MRAGKSRMQTEGWVLPVAPRAAVRVVDGFSGSWTCAIQDVRVRYYDCTYGSCSPACVADAVYGSCQAYVMRARCVSAFRCVMLMEVESVANSSGTQ